MTPARSIVIASCRGDGVLGDCLAALEPQRGDAEVIAVGPFEGGPLESLVRRYPWATFLPVAPGTSVFVQRTHGLRASHGERVLLLEDHCRAAPTWLEALARTDGVAGGPVSGDAPRSMSGFALYLVEYSALIPPLAEDKSGPLLAVNAAYDRRLLLAHEAVWRDGFYDNEVHDALRRSGWPARVVPEARVESSLELPFPRACAHLFAGGRRFGGYRGGGAPRVLATVLLPFILLARILWRVACRRPRWLPRTFAAGPLLLAFVAAWSAGELAGTMESGGR